MNAEMQEPETRAAAEPLPEPGASAKQRLPIALGAGAVVLAAITLTAFGRPLWCKCGSAVPWSLDVQSMHNSQHLIDAYTLTHVLHGLAFYGVLWLAFRSRLRVATRFAVAVAIESAWEVVENTDWIIEKYRAETLSLDYFGDSVLNSLGDVGACALGLLIARKLPWWGSLLILAAIEVSLLLWIRDSLALNLIQLIHPIEAIKAWQTAGF